MQADITLKNYRCFSDTRPARFAIQNGFLAFVGANNSGKSSLLKFFYEFRGLFSRPPTAPASNFFRAILHARDDFTLGSSVLDIEEVFCKFNNRNLILEIAPKQEDPGAIGDYTDEFAPTRISLEIPRGTNRYRPSFKTAAGVIQTRDNSDLDFDGEYLRIDGVRKVNLTDFKKICNILSDTVYVGAFRNAINTGADAAYFDIQVGQAFVQAWKAYKTGNVKKRNEIAYEVTENIKRIFNFADLEINSSEDNKTLQVFIDGKSYRLAELGAGLAQFILVLVTVAIRQPAYILIDEPELNLHPSLQLDFLTTLGSYAREGVLFATHNIGLARACADRIYTVRKEADGTGEIADLATMPRLSEFLGELSFSGYKELGFDKILLVEGQTDLRAIQQLLRMFKKDHQVVLLPLGGSQLINGEREFELQELKRISENIFALIDSERKQAQEQLAKNRRAFIATCEKVGISHHVLERRALENYWSDRAVKRVKGEKYGALTPYQRLNEASPAWSKSENWRIARETEQTEIENTDLGQFLAKL